MGNQLRTEPATVPPAHPLVEATEQSLLAAEPYKGILRPRLAVEAFDVAVTPSSVPRAIAFIDSLLRASAADGIKVRIEEPRRYDPRRRTIATVDGEDLALRLMEHQRQRPHKPTTEEKAATRRGSIFDPPKWDLQPSGIFSILSEGANGGWPSRKWTDGRRGRLEQKLAKIIRGLHDLAANIKQVRTLREQERLAELERQRLAALEQERLRKEKEFRDTLLADAEDWRRGRLLRRYVREVQNHVLTHCGPVQKEWLGSWIERALGVADSLDPILRIEPDQKLRAQPKPVGFSDCSASAGRAVPRWLTGRSPPT